VRNKDRRDEPRLWSMSDDQRTLLEGDIAVGTVSGFAPHDLSLVVASPQLHAVAGRSLIALESLVTELQSKGLLEALESREQVEEVVTHLQMLLRQIRREKEILDDRTE